MYADDTVLYRSDVDIVKNYRNIQGDLNRLVKWCTNNGLTINICKTKVVNFLFKKFKKIKDLHMNKQILIYEKHYKYLGIILDSKLNFEMHYKELLKTFSFKLYLFRRIRNNLNDMAAKSILKAMVLTYLDYGSLVLTIRPMEDILTIQGIQNKLLRACLRIKNYVDTPVYELYLRLNVQPFDKRMQYFLLCSIYRNIRSGSLKPVVPKIRT